MQCKPEESALDICSPFALLFRKSRQFVVTGVPFGQTDGPRGAPNDHWTRAWLKWRPESRLRSIRTVLPWASAKQPHTQLPSFIRCRCYKIRRVAASRAPRAPQTNRARTDHLTPSDASHWSQRHNRKQSEMRNANSVVASPEWN